LSGDRRTGALEAHSNSHFKVLAGEIGIACGQKNRCVLLNLYLKYFVRFLWHGKLFDRRKKWPLQKKLLDSYSLKQQLGAVCSLGHIQACICPGSGSQSNCNHSGDISLLNLICAGKFYLYEGDFYSSHRIQYDMSRCECDQLEFVKDIFSVSLLAMHNTM
jgi:hypothetical protein